MIFFISFGVFCFLLMKFFFVFFIFAGRVKNAWDSPAGCLMFSYTVQMDNGRVLPLLQYVVSLAVTEAIKDICLQQVTFFSLFEMSM